MREGSSLAQARITEKPGDAARSSASLIIAAGSRRTDDARAMEQAHESQ
jgi:hypothetical protein